MIDQPIYRRLLKAVGKADGEVAVSLLLKELADVFKEFAEELEDLFEGDSKSDSVSTGYWYAEDWLRSWAEEVDNV